MTPRIRSLLPEPLIKRAARAPEAPRVFREFVEALQRLDPPPRTPAAAPAGEAVRKRATGLRASLSAAPPRRRRSSGNGHARPRRPRRRF